MQKAILVMDMPECCDECSLLNYSFDYPVCIISGETRGYAFRTKERKMDKCPLKLVPEKRGYSGHPYDDYGDGFADGYNECLDEILGE